MTTFGARRSRREMLGLLAGGAVGAAIGIGGFARPALADPQTGQVDTLALVGTGLDYSWGRPRPSAIAAAGYSFVCRYLSYNTTGKNLTRSEADALRANGLDIVSNWEDTAGDALGGYSKGVQHANAAQSQAVACGMPASRPIYFSVDFDATAAQQTAINSYYDGVASVLGRARTGAYGGYDVIKRLFDGGKITFGWQTYAWSEGRWDGRAQLRQVQNGITFDGASCDRDEAHAANYGGWGSQPQGVASIYGVLADNRLTYSPIDVRTGVRGATRTSTTALPFTPVAMATLNFNTILLTDSAGKLYRVDVVTNSSSLVYNAPIVIGASGWTHDLLAADGAGHLFGIAGDTLRRYTITAAKPTASNITANTVIDSGFTLKTLTAVGANRILGTTAAGALRSYLINGAGAWDGATLRSSTWTFTHMLSPGGGVYFARNSGGALIQYQDANPNDGNGDDITNERTVDASGWTQKLLSAQPGTVH